MTNIWNPSVNSKLHHLHSHTDATVITFLRIRDITPILVNTCCRLSPSRGTPSANVSALSAPGSQRWRMNRETYALKFFSDFPRKSRTNLAIKEINNHCYSLKKSSLSREKECHINQVSTICTQLINRHTHYKISILTASIKSTPVHVEVATRNHHFL